ncbi:MAG: bifunctional folylpolyglutamate synthase/dihydrofolate synthase [Planctomycetota bacterium]|jgi:dihydrofolate synthase/folylpolyglutamate synthase
MLPKETTVTPYEEILEYLNRFTNYERRPPQSADGECLHLARIEHILSRLGGPQTHYEVIHIAGSKGKGSTATMTAALLSALGLRVGLYTSPHLHTVRERISLDGRPISKEMFAESFTLLAPILTDLEADPTLGAATYFEVLTALAFLTFANASVDVAVVEVGLGGRLDATNVVSPAVVGVTPISLDHTEILGHSIGEIAGEKAGIFKAGVPVVLAKQAEEAEHVFAHHAEEKGCKLRRVGSPSLQVQMRHDGKAGSPPLLSFITWRGDYEGIRQPLLGQHQAENAGLAVGLVECYLERKGSRDLSAGVMKRAWRALNIPGRLEVVSQKPLVVLDGAHNPASIWVLSEALRDAFPERRVVAVFAAASDKDVTGMLHILAPFVGALVLTSTGQPRSASIMSMEQGLEGIEAPECRSCSLPLEALEEARKLAGPEGVILVTGSLYLVGQIRGEFFPELKEG